jgi:DNA-binding helix-hairpin-helix protein with protein kinase domain
LPLSTISPTPLPENAKSTQFVFVCGWILYTIAFALFLANAPFLAIIAALFATGMVCEGSATPEFIAERQRRQTISSQTEREVAALRVQIDNGIKKYNSEFDKATAELRQAYQRFSGLDHEQRSELQGLERDKRQLQLNDFLRTQLVSRGKIKGIGFVRKQLLLSYGVGSALDIRPNLDIPGFGPTYISYLMNWRRSCEMRFQYDPSRGVPPVELQRVNLKFTTLRNDLSRKLKQGPTSLTNLSAGAQGRCLQLQGQFEMAYRRFAQARADLNLCR